MNQPLQYDSLKSVLQFINPNLRLKLSLRCPQIKSADNATAFRIKKLYMDSTSFDIDNVSYQLGIIKIYNDGATPGFVLRNNDNGGGKVDVDKYGFMVTGHPRSLRREQRLLDKFKNELQALETGFNSVERAERIEHLKNKILSYQLRIDDQEPPFKFYLQLRIVTKDTVAYERVEYNKTIKDGFEYLFRKFLGGRGKPLEVGYFMMENGSKYPDNMRKMNVRSLGRVKMRFISRIVDYLSYPVDMIEFDEFTNTNHPVFQSAKMLVGIGSFNLFNIISHKRIHLKGPSNEILYMDDFIDKAKDCLLPDGTYFSYGISSRQSVKEVLEHLESRDDVEIRGVGERFEEKTNGDYKFVFAIPNYTELCLYFDEMDKENKELFADKWMFHAKILEIN